SPSIPLITALHDLGAAVRGYDPAGMEQAKPLLPDLHYCNSAYSAAEGADAIVIATEWEQFRALDLSRLKCLMTQPVIVDLRNIYRADEMRRAGFHYVPIGRNALERNIVPGSEPRLVTEQRAAGRIFEIAINRGRVRNA